MRILGVTLIALFLAAGGSQPAIPVAACLATGAPRDSIAVIALTDNGRRIVVLGATSGELLHSFDLGPVRHLPPPLEYPAGSIVLDEPTCEVIVAAVDSSRGTTGVFALSLRDWKLRNVATIADTSGFLWVDVGSSSGRLYLFGRTGIEVVVLDRSTGNILDRVSVSRPGRVGRQVYRARVSPDERRVYVSYHGGLDWVDLASRKLCTDAPTLRWHGGLGCLEDVHGDFDFFGNDVIAATGGPELVLVDSGGVVRDSMPMNLVNRYGLSDHFMWPSIDRRRGIAYGTMMCDLGRGVTSIAIVGSTAPQGTRIFADGACGEHISPATDGSAVIVKDYYLGQLTIVDTRSGMITRTFGRAQAGEHIVDVLGVAVEHP